MTFVRATLRTNMRLEIHRKFDWMSWKLADHCLIRPHSHRCSPLDPADVARSLTVVSPVARLGSTVVYYMIARCVRHAVRSLTGRLLRHATALQCMVAKLEVRGFAELKL